MEQGRACELFQATGWLLGPWCLPRDVSAEPLSIFLPRRKQSLVPSSEVKPCAEFRGRTILGPWGWDTPLPGRRSVSLLLETMFCQITQKICAQRGQSPCAVIILTPPEKARTQKRNHVTQAPAFFSFTPTPCISFKRAAAKTEPASSPAKGLMSVIWEVGKKARCFGCI